MGAMQWHVICAAALFLVHATAAVAARGETSAAAARALAMLLDRNDLTAIAAADPSQPGIFVAALYLPGSQLLVVQAQHPSMTGLQYRIDNRQYRDAYLDLQASPTPGGKFFIQDAGADGLVAEASGGDVDVLYEDGVRQTLFNGKPREQNLTPAQYAAKAAAADERYTRLLALLASALTRAD
jgi:hypothetical protein